jgi:hypothetical protein
MMHKGSLAAAALGACVAAVIGAAALQLAPPEVRAADAGPGSGPPPPDYQSLTKLPDWSGVWTPVISDQVAQEQSNPPPWKPAIARQIAKMYADEEAGHPFEIIDHCASTPMGDRIRPIPIRVFMETPSAIGKAARW